MRNVKVRKYNKGWRKECEVHSNIKIQYTRVMPNYLNHINCINVKNLNKSDKKVNSELTVIIT